MNTELFGISGPTFVAGIEIKNGTVYKTAPILNYMKGWTLEDVENYCKKHKFKITDMTPDSQPPKRVA